MITKVKGYTSRANATLLPLAVPGRIETDLLQITNISGLEPIKATINTNQNSDNPGAAFTGSSLPFRNIVLTIRPNPDWIDWTVESLRKLLYLYFQSGLQVQLVFEDDVKPPVTIFGYVESFVSNQFTKDGTFQISIVCPYPYFTSLDPIVITGRTTNVYTPQVIDYEGDVETGVVVEVDSHAGQAQPSLITIETGLGSFIVDNWIDASQKFIMSSIDGDKFVDNVRPSGNLIVGLFDYIHDGSVWPTFDFGPNSFSVITDAGSHDWTLTYYERFGGL